MARTKRAQGSDSGRQRANKSRKRKAPNISAETRARKAATMKAHGMSWEEIAAKLRVRVDTARDYRARGVFLEEYQRASRVEVAWLEDSLYPAALRRLGEIVHSDDEHESNTAIKTVVQTKQHRDRMTLSLMELQAARLAAATAPGGVPGAITVHLALGGESASGLRDLGEYDPETTPHTDTSHADTPPALPPSLPPGDLPV